jgi:hypothetical protein
MNKNVQSNLILIVAAAVVLVAVNIGVWAAASNGAIAPVENPAVWGIFILLNVFSILWATSLLGLQPLVVALSYVAGACLAYSGVRGMPEISVAEVTTAGATYGAFGALTIGNATARVRLAFFRKGQVPFVFVILGLIVLDGILNSRVSHAGGAVVLNALVFPFLLAGVLIGLVWMVLNRFGIGCKREHAIEVGNVDEVVENTEPEPESEVVSEPRVFRMRETTKRKRSKPVEVEPVDMPVIAEKEPASEPVLAESKVIDEPEVAPEPEVNAEPEEIPETPEAEEKIILPGIGEDDTFEESDKEFTAPSFDPPGYGSAAKEDEQGSVMVEEPQKSVATDDEEAAEQEQPVDEKDSSESEESQPGEKREEWLSGHLDLLNKLK